MDSTIGRRELLKRLSLLSAGVAIPSLGLRIAKAQGEVPVIAADSSYLRGQWFFDPAGLYIEKGQTVRWVAGNYGPTVTAFHPSIDNHELRIPEGAQPFDSGVMVEHSQRYKIFEWTFDVEGTYDYFSRTFEPLGMVGRIIVGRPGGPAEQNPPGYGARDGRAVVFPAQAKILAALPSERIVSQKSIPYPRDIVTRTFPYG